MSTERERSVLRDAFQFPLGDALFGRRSRRFSFGTSIPDGPLTFRSSRDVLPLTDLEQMMLLTATCGNTGWHYIITRHARYAPHISNYSAAAGGRTFPSAAGGRNPLTHLVAGTEYLPPIRSTEINLLDEEDPMNRKYLQVVFRT